MAPYKTGVSGYRRLLLISLGIISLGKIDR
jgi:hypothetical protein